MDTDIGLILDGVILVFLAVTIFYASRLTIFLKNFRASRDTVEKLIRDLSTAIDKSESSIYAMHQNAADADEQLQAVIKEASFLSDELRFINETGDNLADRLDKLVDQNRELVDQLEDNGGVGRPKVKIDKQGFNHLEDEGWNLELEKAEDEYVEPRGRAKPTAKEKVRSEQEASLGAFLINDRDFEDGFMHDDEEETAWSTLDSYDAAEEAANLSFSSQAERDLYEALQSRKKNTKTLRVKESA